MRISDLLQHKGSEVATVHPSATIGELVGRLAEYRIGAVVVSSDGRAIDGIASERDIARGLHENGSALLDQPVSSIMTVDVRTCAPNVDIVELAKTMTEHRIRHVPVVVDGKLAGIVSIGDVVKARIEDLESERAQLVGYITQ